MLTGTCTLCGTVQELHDSHFFPSGVYRLLRKSTGANQSPVLMSRRIALQTDYQMKQPLLCTACERRFSDNGENYVIPLLSNGRRFPLLDRLTLALPLYATEPTVHSTAVRSDYPVRSLGISG